ncbi:MAG: hypothetical protein ACP5FH_02830 [Terracidiphilus sp.]
MSLAVYIVYLHCSAAWYVRIYWSYAFLDEALQLGIVWEIARTVMRPTGTWMRDARKQFLLWAAAGVLLAAAFPWLVTPPGASLIKVVEVRVGLFASLMICELYIVMMRVSTRLGLGWRNHVMALGNGWMIWSVVAILVEGCHSFFGVGRYFSVLEHVRMFVFLGVLVYWIVQFWMEEPARQPISPELEAYIRDLHRRVKNDLDTMGTQR